MKKIFIIMLMAIVGAFAANAQRYMVEGKKGDIRVVEYVLVDGEWAIANPPAEIHVPNGYEFEAVPPVSKDKIVMEYEGKYYHVVFPKEELKVIDDMGKDSHLGMGNALRNSWLGKWYFTSSPGVLALLCSLVAFIASIISLFKENPSRFMPWAIALPLAFIALLEIGAICSVGGDAYWWVNPDDVGYFIAIVMLIPFGITVAMQCYALKLTAIAGPLPGALGALVKLLLGIGMVAGVLAALGVVMNFLFAALTFIGFIWLAGQGTTRKDSSGNEYYTNIFGTRKVNK